MPISRLKLVSFFGLLSFFIQAQDYTYEACLVQKDAINIAFSLKICNNTSTTISDFSIAFDWDGFTDVTTDYGLAVVKDGSSNNEVEFSNINWGPTIPANGCQTFTIRGKHA
jgi:hypothetical protein